jgi:hypothetical protein
MTRFEFTNGQLANHFKCGLLFKLEGKHGGRARLLQMAEVKLNVGQTMLIEALRFNLPQLL